MTDRNLRSRVMRSALLLLVAGGCGAEAPADATRSDTPPPFSSPAPDELEREVQEALRAAQDPVEEPTTAVVDDRPEPAPATTGESPTTSEGEEPVDAREAEAPSAPGEVPKPPEKPQAEKDAELKELLDESELTQEEFDEAFSKQGEVLPPNLVAD